MFDAYRYRKFLFKDDDVFLRVLSDEFANRKLIESEIVELGADVSPHLIDRAFRDVGEWTKIGSSIDMKRYFSYICEEESSSSFLIVYPKPADVYPGKVKKFLVEEGFDLTDEMEEIIERESFYKTGSPVLLFKGKRGVDPKKWQVWVDPKFESVESAIDQVVEDGDLECFRQSVARALDAGQFVSKGTEVGNFASGEKGVKTLTCKNTWELPVEVELSADDQKILEKIEIVGGRCIVTEDCLLQISHGKLDSLVAVEVHHGDVKGDRIESDSPLWIKGDVLESSEIHSSSIVRVDGDVSNSIVSVADDLIVKGRVSGRKSRILSRDGNVAARSFEFIDDVEGLRIIAIEGLIYGSYYGHCGVFALGGGLVTGEVYSQGMILLERAGKDVGSLSKIFSGSGFGRDVLYDLEKEEARLNQERAELYSEISLLDDGKAVELRKRYSDLDWDIMENSKQIARKRKQLTGIKASVWISGEVKAGTQIYGGYESGEEQRIIENDLMGFAVRCRRELWNG